MILAGAKNPGKLFEDTAGAGWVRVERGVRPEVIVGIVPGHHELNRLGRERTLNCL